jgi:hypothetical protein
MSHLEDWHTEHSDDSSTGSKAEDLQATQLTRGNNAPAMPAPPGPSPPPVQPDSRKSLAPTESCDRDAIGGMGAAVARTFAVGSLRYSELLAARSSRLLAGLSRSLQDGAEWGA